ncbi:hypothetical protein [Pontiella agarivorans]|uniref:Transposase n=1 Tax=Pontiella agarivorans TaxID=3038953 RepID=A0ABU5MYY0_9BACT|nr:hypothetical protein [Pontiella agarivorans]MDZ8119296.1 hypothetical protein [Pontiella agarivorans]
MTGIDQEIFDDIVTQAIKHKLIDGKTLYTDSTHLKANANKIKFTKKQVSESVRSYTEQLDALGVDSGYNTAAICKGLSERRIYGVMPCKRPMGKPGILKKRDFTYDEHYDGYLCPEGKVLSYSTTNCEGHHEYKSDPPSARTAPG